MFTGSRRNRTALLWASAQRLTTVLSGVRQCGFLLRPSGRKDML